MSPKSGETWARPFTMPRMKKSSTVPQNSSRVAREAKALVALAFRNGPIENVHAGKTCPTCHGKAEYSHITQAEMRRIMHEGYGQSSLHVSGSEGARPESV